MSDPTETVRTTDYDALSCRYSVQVKQYLADPWLMPYLASLEEVFRYEYKNSARRNFNSIVKGNKLPIINRGTYIRSICIDSVIQEFVEKFDRARIVSLGAGSDTRLFKWLSQNEQLEYIEMDFSQSTKIKHGVISLSPQLSEIIGIPSVEPSSEWYSSLSDSLETQRYRLIPIDLRRIDQLERVIAQLNPDIPTLVVSEAVLCYIESNISNEIISTLQCHFHQGAIAIYDPIGGEGSFGDVMVENLRIRNLRMPSLLEFNTLEKYEQRLLQSGITNVKIDDTYTIYNNWIADDEKKRVSRLEFLDEIEELKLLLEHYCLALGWWGFSWDDLSLRFNH
jgi:[phosphatase 2A protein]-leucine-carboxy methyltransferase